MDSTIRVGDSNQHMVKNSSGRTVERSDVVVGGSS